MTKYRNRSRLMGNEGYGENIQYPTRKGLNLIGYPFTTDAPLNGTSLVMSGAVAAGVPELADRVIEPVTLDFAWLKASDPLSPFFWVGADGVTPAMVLRPGQAYWYRHAGRGFEWIETRSHETGDSAPANAPRVTDIRFGPNLDQAILDLDVGGLRPGSFVSVYIRSIGNADEWTLADGNIPVGARTSIAWTDRDLHVPARVYAVVPGRVLAGVPGPGRGKPSQILVRPRAGLNEAEFQAMLNAHGGRQHDAIPQINTRMVRGPLAR